MSGPVAPKGAMTSQAFPEALVGRIYDAALDATLWPSLLCEIADTCGVENTALVIVDRAAGYSSVVSPRTARRPKPSDAS